MNWLKLIQTILALLPDILQIIGSIEAKQPGTVKNVAFAINEHLETMQNDKGFHPL
jgi:hypothetical protein